MPNEAVRAGINDVMVHGDSHAGREKASEIKNRIEAEEKPQHINAKTTDTNHRQGREKALGKPIGGKNTQPNAHELYGYDESGRASIFEGMTRPGRPGKQAFAHEPNKKEGYYEMRRHSNSVAADAASLLRRFTGFPKELSLARGWSLSTGSLILGSFPGAHGSS